MADQVSYMLDSGLVALDVPCPHCTGEAGVELRAAMAADWKAWGEEETQLLDRWMRDRAARGLNALDFERWRRTDEYQALLARKPEMPGSGCVECDWTSVQLTDAGRELLAFLRRHKAV